MKIPLLLFILSVGGASAWADIQDPPMNDYGPTRKLGRALSNIIWSVTEIPDTVCKINDREGNAAGTTYGFVKGVGRVVVRTANGVYELLTFPFPTYNGSYRPPYRSNIPWIHGGLEEYPPELGFDTKYRYVRVHEGW